MQLHGRERPGCGYSGSGGARPRCHPGNLVETSFVEKAFYESRASPPSIQYSFNKQIAELVKEGYLIVVE